MSKDLYPHMEISSTTDLIENELRESRYVLHDLLLMLDHHSVHQHYEGAVKGLCEGKFFECADVAFVYSMRSFAKQIPCIETIKTITHQFCSSFWRENLYFLSVN